MPVKKPATPKIQRWVDLIAALLAHTYAVTFDQLAEAIPAYGGPGKKESILRTFERDKDELRAFGVPIETMTWDEGETTGYRLRAKNFYLPYLALLASGNGTSKPKRAGDFRYQALSLLAFEPDELLAIRAAAVRVEGLGDPDLAANARAAIRKLAFDLPVTDGPAPDDVRVVRSMAQPDAALFPLLNVALLRRKLVRFTYRTMANDRTARREVEPYGLFFLSSHWYLAGRDTDSGAVRNYRLNRISRLAVNSKRARSPDFTVPADFTLREHARSRQAWALGDGDGIDAIAELAGDTGVIKAARGLGSSVPGSATRRRFQVRRPDVFLRWLLSFGGRAWPMEPPELVHQFRDLARNTLELYDPA